MFGTLGVPEIAIIFILALVLFGPKKLPELGRTIGKAMTEFRRASSDLKATFDREMQTLERENQSLQASTRETAKEIYDHATYELPPAETIWNPLEPHNGDQLITSPQTPASSETSNSTATEPSTVDASAVSGVESNGAVEEAVSSPPEPVPALEGTVPRTEQPLHS